MEQQEEASGAGVDAGRTGEEPTETAEAESEGTLTFTLCEMRRHCRVSCIAVTQSDGS